MINWLTMLSGGLSTGNVLPTRPIFDCLGDIVVPQVRSSLQTVVEPWTPTPWIILGLLVLIAGLDIWLLVRYRNAISRQILKWSKRWKWFRVIVVAGLAILTWHWSFGLPEKYYEWCRELQQQLDSQRSQ